MNIYIDNRQDILNISKNLIKNIEDVVRESLKEENKDLNTEVSISFVTDKEIQKLNDAYRGVNSPTDVLSFPLELDFDMPEKILGDIIISTETARSQAVEFNHSIEREILYLVTHSMFHLMGYDHIDDEDKKLMRCKEELILNRLNISRDFKGE